MDPQFVETAMYLNKKEKRGRAVLRAALRLLEVGTAQVGPGLEHHGSGLTVGLRQLGSMAPGARQKVPRPQCPEGRGRPSRHPHQL